MKKILLVLFIGLQLQLCAYYDREESVQLYVGQGVDNNLPDILTDLFNETVDYAPTNIYSLSYTKITYEPFEHINFGYEFDIAQHSGLQDNQEVGAVGLIMLEALLPENPLLDFDFTFGMGLSHAIGSPSYEDGSTANPDKRYNTQLFIILDLDFYIPDYSDIHFFIRKHHRSGAYGFVAPEHVGSNFVGYGLRFIF